MSDIRKTPAIRFKGFTDDWEQCELVSFGNSTGGTSIESAFSDEGKYKVISIGSYSESSIYNDQGIKALENEKTKIRVLNKNDLTMILNDKTASGRIIGRVLLIDKDNTYVYNQRTQRIEPNTDRFDPLFIYHLLNAPQIREKIIKQAQGNTQIYVNWSAIKETVYLLPELEEQIVLGEYFERLNYIITLHQRKYEKLQQVKKALLEKMFPKEGEIAPKIRFKGYTDAWEQYKLSQFYEFSKGRGLSLDSFYEGNDSLGIAYGHLYTKYTEVINEVYLSTNDENGVLSRIGDLLFPGSSTVPFGTAQSNALMVVNVKLGGDVIIARSKDLSVYSPFISYQINAQKSKLFPITVGTTITHMYGKNIANIEYKFPKLDEQQKIGRTLESLDSLITLHKHKHKKLQNIKKALLQKMFV